MGPLDLAALDRCLHCRVQGCVFGLFGQGEAECFGQVAALQKCPHCVLVPFGLRAADCWSLAEFVTIHSH